MVFKYFIDTSCGRNDRISIIEIGGLMNKVFIYQEIEGKIKEIKQIKKVLLYALKKEKLNHTTFNVIVTDQEKIHELNKTYRNIDHPTDVITFALEDEKRVVTKSKYRILGDIYISYDQAKEQAVKYGHSFLRELSFLAVHGFYHLLGYDHQTKEEEKIMFQKQEEVLDSYGIKRNQ